LGPNQAAVCSRADPLRVVKVFGKVAGQWPASRWLSRGNRYATKTTDRIESDLANPTGLRQLQLERYIAASAAIHCVDGWSYVSRASEAIVSGDIDAATHLAYYAELRAAMSLMATSGIGIFKDKHFTVTSTGRCERINGNTHKIAWEILNYWATLPAAAKIVLEVIRPGGVSLDNWLMHFPAAASAQAQGRVVSGWLLEWGIDLQRFADDREARNDASYRPTSITSSRRFPIEKSLQYLESYWRAFEPTSAEPFKVLDRYLLRRSMATAFSATQVSGVHPKRAPVAFRRFVQPVLHAVTPSDLSAEQWEQFLLYESERDELPILLAAEGNSDNSSADHHMEALARAAMMLRVATGAARQLIRGRTPEEIRCLAFWWHGIGEGRGLWREHNVPPDLTDLWADIEEALAEAGAWRANGGRDRQAFLQAHPLTAIALSSSERIALWGLGV